MSIPKEIRDYKRLAHEQGWTVVHTGKNHFKWIPPEGEIYVSSGTPSDPRTLRHIKHALCKRGLRLTKTRSTA